MSRKCVMVGWTVWAWLKSELRQEGPAAGVLQASLLTTIRSPSLDSLAMSSAELRSWADQAVAAERNGRPRGFEGS